MKERIEAYLKDGETIIPDWKAYLVDKSIPLDERWQAFVVAPAEWKYDDPYGPSLDTLREVIDSPYDQLYVERYQTETITALRLFVV